MNIYGVALLAACYLLGKLIGDLLGVVLDINGNIGGVVAMSASQNVKAALTGGWAAVLVGIISTATCFMLVPVVSKLGKSNNSVEF